MPDLRTYHLAVTAVLRDPQGEMIRLGTTRYAVTGRELWNGEGNLAGPYALQLPMLPPVYLPGNSGGQVLVSVELVEVTGREVTDLTA